MTPQELKNSILQLAIQGRLVEQRPEEGTAQELYQQIQAEKQRLIREGKIKKEKPLPEITEDEKPFEIPESWMWMRVGNCGSWGSGATPSRTNLEYYNGTIPWLKTGDLNDGIVVETPEHITQLALEKTSVRLNPVGSVLMAMYGATIGKLGILGIEATTNQACCACIPYEGIYNKYLFYFLMASRTIFIKMGEGGAQPNISKEKIVNTSFPLPPLAEQKRIVVKIEELLPLVERYETAWTRLEDFNCRFPEDMKKSILQQAIQGKLVEQRPEEGTAAELFAQIQKEKQRLIKEGKIKKEKPLPEITEDEKPFEIPESWMWVRLRDIIAVLGDGIHGTPQFDDTGEYFFINGNNLIKGEIVIKSDTKRVSHEEFEKYKKPLDENTILVSINGTIGNYAFYNNEPVILGKSACFFSLINGIYKEYICRLLNTQHFWDYAAKEATQTTIKNVSLKSMRMLPVPLPPLAEQKRIVARLEELLPLCERLK